MLQKLIIVVVHRQVTQLIYDVFEKGIQVDENGPFSCSMTSCTRNQVINIYLVSTLKFIK